MAAVAATGCTGSAERSASPTPSAVAPTVAVDAAAAKLLVQAASRVRRVRSYAFSASSTVTAASPVRSVIAGRVVKGHGISYRLSVKGTRSQVVRVRHATYVRKVPGKWSRLAHAHRVADPSRSLLAVLRGTLATGAGVDGAITRVVGSLPGEAAKAADLPTDGRPAQVSVSIDKRDRVVGLRIVTHARAGANDVTVFVASTYSRFGRVAPIRPPR